MRIGIYQGAASLAACEKWQEVVARNIAAAAVPGFKRTAASFDAVLADTTKVGGESRFAHESRGVMPAMSTRLSMAPGELRNTGNELDFAIQGAGFFQIQRPNGAMGYTRNGSFHLNAERTLVNAQGMPVMGDGGAITLKPGGGRVSINDDGMLIQGETPVAKLAIYDFAEPQKLRAAGDGLLAPADANVQPQQIERPAVMGGALEGSNVAPLEEMIGLVTLSRAYEASQRVILTHDEATDKAIQILGNPNS